MKCWNCHGEGRLLRQATFAEVENGEYQGGYPIEETCYWCSGTGDDGKPAPLPMCYNCGLTQLVEQPGHCFCCGVQIV